MYHGDIRLGDTIDIKFGSRRFSTGAPYTLAGSPAVAAYVGNGTTEITAGITLTTDFDSRTGLNNVRVVATSGNGFATATNVKLVLTAGTVDSVSVSGEVIGSFSIENRSALNPTTAGRTLDVTATGAAGIDWANVENPTSPVNLTFTSVSTVATLTNLPAITANWLTATGIAADAFTAAKFAASSLNGKGDWALASTMVDAAIAGTRFLTMIVLDGAVYQFTENALEQGPGGGGDCYGPGDTAYSPVIRQTGGTPIPNAKVWISTDEEGLNVVAGTVVTDVNGEIPSPFMLDSGTTYYLWASSTLYNFDNPQEFTVP